MFERLNEAGYLVAKSNSLDWQMHESNKEVLISRGNSEEKKMIKYLDEGTNYIIIRDFKDEKGKEFTIIVKDEDKYFFVTEEKYK